MADTQHSKIFLGCLPLGIGTGRVWGSTPGGDMLGFALAEDGTGLAQHLSSNAEFAKHDMGLTSDWKHELYQAHYPNGFDLVWVDDPTTHQGYRDALALNKARHEAEELAAITLGGAE